MNASGKAGAMLRAVAELMDAGAHAEAEELWPELFQLEAFQDDDDDPPEEDEDDGE